MTIFIISLA